MGNEQQTDWYSVGFGDGYSGVRPRYEQYADYCRGWNDGATQRQLVIDEYGY